MTPNLILQALEDFGDGFQFERLCNDIMHLHYPRFKPRGHVHDLGADGLLELDDGEIRLYFKRSADTRETLIFQYSIQEAWEAKVKATLKKLNRNKRQYDRLVYVTNRNPTTAAVVKLQLEAQASYRKQVEVHNQEFLRVYLEQPQNSHLVEQYFASYLFQLKRWGVETSIFANVPLAERYKRKALVLLSACVRSQEGQEVREAAATEIILGCIYGEDGRRACSRNAIQDEICAAFSDRNCLSVSLIDSTLNELTENKRIYITEDGFSLSEIECTRIDTKTARAYEEDHAFYKHLVEELKQQNGISTDQERDVRMTIAKGIGRIFEQMGLGIANAVTDRGQSVSLNEYPEMNIIIQEVVSSLDSQLREATVRVLKRLFTSPTPFEAQYLYGIAESYLVYASFGLDPDACMLDLASMRENVLFIDTDIIVQVFVGERTLRDLCRKMLKATQNLGIKMYTHPQMLHEFVYKVARSHEDYVYMGRPPRLPTNQLEDLGDVFRTFFSDVAHTGQTWDQFVTSLVGKSRDQEEQKAFVQNRLEMEYGIQAKDFSAEISLSEEEIASFAGKIAEEREAHQAYKHDDLYETDATIALLIEKLQEKRDGNRYRLLSSDTFLPRVWQRRIKETAHAFLFPPRGWFQYVMHHPTSRSTPTDFALLMKSLSVSPSRPQVPRNLLLTLIRYGVNISKYSTEALEELSKRLYEQWIWREVINKRPSQISDDQAVELKQALASVLEQVEGLVTPDHAELRGKIKQDELVIEKLVSDKRQLVVELEEYKKKERRRKRYHRQIDRRKPKKPKRKKRF